MSRQAGAIRLLLLGATGAVGQAVLQQALANKKVTQLCAPTRRPLTTKHAKLNNPIVDFSKLPAMADWYVCDAVICTLGTTIKIAGSQAAFAFVDCDLPVAMGGHAKAAGATRYALTSSLGASPKGNFYLRTKAAAEQGIVDLGFASTTIVRPSLIDAERSDSRPGERLGIYLARAAKPLIPRRYRAVTPEQIATALLAGVLQGKAGIEFIESASL